MVARFRDKTDRHLLKVLEQTSLPRILIYLLEFEKANRTQLKNKIEASQDTIYRALGIAREMGLIEDERGMGFGGAVVAALTPKGRLVAEKLLDIKRILEI